MRSELKEKRFTMTPEIIKQIEANAKEPDLTDPDAPEITDEQIALATRRGKPLKEVKKLPIALRLPALTLKKLRASGKGWQTRLSDKISELVMKGLL
jgi:uncharacterized protein (DUF4415 family)